MRLPEHSKHLPVQGKMRTSKKEHKNKLLAKLPHVLKGFRDLGVQWFRVLRVQGGFLPTPSTLGCRVWARDFAWFGLKFKGSVFKAYRRALELWSEMRAEPRSSHLRLVLQDTARLFVDLLLKS